MKNRLLILALILLCCIIAALGFTYMAAECDGSGLHAMGWMGSVFSVVAVMIVSGLLLAESERHRRY